MSDLKINDASLVTVEGFVNAYFKNLKTCSTNLEAYEMTAEQYRKVFGHDKYSSYDSFRVVKNRKFKQN